MHDDRLKAKAKRALRRYFEKKRSPRFMLSLVILVTGLVGFALSFGLLKAGMTGMWLRYPLALLGSYVFFLGLIRVWVEIEKQNIDPNDPAITEAMDHEEAPEPVFRQSKDSSWLDGLDIPSGLDGDGFFPFLLITSPLDANSEVLSLTALGAELQALA